MSIFQVVGSWIYLYGIRGGCLYSLKGWVHLRASIIRISGRNGKAAFVVLKLLQDFVGL
jgi:hypothetical protein